MIHRMTESDWMRRLRQIQQGLVVPVVGSRLLCNRAGDWLPELAAQRQLDLHAEKTRREWLVDAPAPDNAGLVTFLRAFSGETEFLAAASPAAFVVELSQRWAAEQLLPMSPMQAEHAIQDAGQAVLAPGSAAAVVRFVGNLAPPSRCGPIRIEPVLLSLTCTQLNRDLATNALWFGSAAQRDYMKLVAQALMRAGVQLRAIRPFPRDCFNRDLPLVQVEADTDPDLTAKSLYPVEKLLAATSFPR